MKIFISGVCGFAGSELALGLRASGHDVCGCDNFSRAGSELNQRRVEAAGVAWDWRPRTGVREICAEIAAHAREHPEWPEVSGA